MFEALQAGIAYAFDELGFHRVMANYMPVNERSGRLLRRLGFVVEGYARDFLLIDGQWRDHVLTALTAPAKRDPGL
jgi:ribosomal-protein-alanine N-acetyltransferase